jgi:iron(III) transport system permease protein
MFWNMSQKLSRRRSLRTHPPLLFILSALIVLVALIPFFFVLGYVVSIGSEQAVALIWRPRVGELFRNTGLLVTGCVGLTAVLGTGMAWLVERTTLPGRRIWNVLLVAPLAVPAFVNSFGWVSLTARVEGYAGAVLIVSLSYYPLVYLPVAAMLRGLDPALEETAAALGYGPWRTFARVVLPQLRPALLGGTLIVALHTLAEFGALQMLRFPTFTTAIYDLYRSSFNGPAANMLAGVLLLCCMLLLTLELRLRGQHRYSRLGGGSARTIPRRNLGRYRAPCLVAVAALVALALGVPIGSLAFWLVTGSSTAFPVADLVTTAATTFGLGVAGAFVAMALAFPIAWLCVRRRGRLSMLLERSTYFGNAVPGIVVALALVTVSIRFAQPAYQTVVLLVLAYAIMFMPRAMISIRAALDQAPPVFDDVAHALGSGPIETLRRVTLPLVAPGLGAGSALVFLAVVTELTATLLLAPIGTRTLATQFWSNSSSIAYGAAAPYAALMVILSAPVTLLLTRDRWRAMPV